VGILLPLPSKLIQMKYLLAGLCFSVLLLSCSKEEVEPDFTGNKNREQGIFKVLTGDSVMEMNGDIVTATLTHFNDITAAFPTVRRINMLECPGSDDDETNVKIGRIVYSKNMHIHINDNGFAASGAVDFFLAGTKRTKGSNTNLGVHSWEDGNGTEGKDLPMNHPDHDLFLDYYVSIGMNSSDASDFYFFTLNAAPSSSIHWMTPTEITQYNMLTN